MSEGEEDRRKRAAARKTWQIRQFALGAEPEDDLSALSPAERVGMVWRMTQDAWASMGKEIPSYSRNETPVRWVRRRGQGT
ncbi:MAG: hypothetical protein QM778_00675 [Myxococcales bacterium]